MKNCVKNSRTEGEIEDITAGALQLFNPALREHNVNQTNETFEWENNDAHSEFSYIE